MRTITIALDAGNLRFTGVLPHHIGVLVGAFAGILRYPPFAILVKVAVMETVTEPVGTGIDTIWNACFLKLFEDAVCILCPPGFA